MSLKHGTECSTCPSLYVHSYLKKQTNKPNFYFPLNYLHYFSQHLKKPKYLYIDLKSNKQNPETFTARRQADPKLLKK